MQNLELDSKNTSETGYDVSGLRRHWKKLLAISFVFSVFYALVHGILPSGNDSANVPSVIAQQGLLPVAFIAYGVLWFGLLASVFVLVQARLPGGRLVKGVSYGLFFCLITFVLYLEPLPNTATFGFVNMAWMLGDGGPLLLFGALLGISLATGGNVTKQMHAETSRRSTALFVLAIPGAFFLGRLLSYTLVNVYSAFSSAPAATLAWVSLFGLTIGILYYWLRSALIASSPIRTAMFFGLAVFGIDMYLFNFAYFLIVATSASMVIDFSVRITIDALSVTAGVLTFEYLKRRRYGTFMGLGQTKITTLGRCK